MLHGRGRHRSDVIEVRESCIGAASLYSFEKRTEHHWVDGGEGGGGRGGREGGKKGGGERDGAPTAAVALLLPKTLYNGE